jgi:hypothetical protein
MQDMPLILRQNFFLKYGKACFCIHDETEKRITGYTSIQNAAFLYPRKHDETDRLISADTDERPHGTQYQSVDILIKVVYTEIRLTVTPYL